MIELMKFDMGGCAAVLGCAKAIAQLRPKVRHKHRLIPYMYLGIPIHSKTAFNAFLAAILQPYFLLFLINSDNYCISAQNVEVHFITAVCENMVSAEAMRPGDILVASNGKTIEVLNTDAEGRLTLADALVYADKLGVDTIIDLATLTGIYPALSFTTHQSMTAQCNC